MQHLHERESATGLRGAWYRATTRYHGARRWISEAPRRVMRAGQRVVRGWDDSAVWSLDDHIAKTLGQQLVHLADVTHGYPPGYGDITPRTEDSQFIPDAPADDETYRRWVGDIRRHGQALLAYQEAHYTAYGEDYDAIYQPAREALVWVADNFGSLWD